MFKKLLLMSLIAILSVPSHAELRSHKSINMSYTELGIIGGAITCIASLLANSAVESIKAAIEEEYIEQWLKEEKLNGYGDPIGSIYIEQAIIDENLKKHGDPIGIKFQQATPLRLFQSRYWYLQEKFPKKPWFKKHKLTRSKLKNLKKALEFCFVVGYATWSLSSFYGLFSGQFGEYYRI